MVQGCHKVWFESDWFEKKCLELADSDSVCNRYGHSGESRQAQKDIQTLRHRATRAQTRRKQLFLHLGHWVRHQGYYDIEKFKA